MNNLNKNQIIVIVGPTAVGKTKLSIELAKKLDAKIISCDSMQIYKDLNIGTAKIKKSEMRNITHYMIDEINFDVNFNVNDFKNRSVKYLDDLLLKGDKVILVGGTGFYLRAILYDTDFKYEDVYMQQKIRKELYDELKIKGIDYMYDKLRQIDIESYNKIDKQNIKRVIRAIEFYMIHSEKISKHNDDEKNKEAKYNYKMFLLNDDRDKIYERINDRVDKMIKEGLLIEIKNLINAGAKKEYNSMKGIGYKELYDYCYVNNFEKLYMDTNKFNYKDYNNELKDIIDLIKKNSRNYAKRQITWFKNQTDSLEININNFDYDFGKIADYVVKTYL